MLETIALIVSVAIGILSGISSIKGLTTERKSQMVDLFSTIADTIDEAVTKFKANEVPHGACERMRQYALQLPSVLSGHLDDTKLAMYSQQLYEAHQIEQLYMEVQKDSEQLVNLEKAASAFRVAANLIKLSK